MKDIRRCLTEFKFSQLFTQHLLWDGFRAKHAFELNGQYFEVEGVAEKRGLVAFICQPMPNYAFPGSAERKRIEREIEKLHHEHLIVFIDREHTRQVWSVPKREDGKSKGTSEIPFFRGKGVEHLARRIQKLSFSLQESETTTIVEVAARVNQALFAERVTKKFFKEFSDQRKGFVKFLDWIEDESMRDWYCSVLLNRLMFIYFLGGKGFLPGGTAFLTDSLAKNIRDNGPDTFYTHFLLPLSFFGLGEKRDARGRFEETFKDVLYLDGGLFTVHQVERELGLNKEAVEKGVFPAEAKIPDIEFKRWFDYFDKWRWTLDEDKVENDGYISPHILGYIFEKYINQKQMGAYYTKEDITGYICRNTIIPRLFDMLAETSAKGSKAVRPLPIGPHPSYMNEGRGISDGEGIDRYVYPSVKQEAKLPTETDYEQEQRRKRYESILEDFDAEKIQGIDDFITYNLDIEKLALDFVSNIQDPEVLHAFYFKGLQQITVLDPTCGSGAFLFESLIIMYPLYNACLSRMQYLVGKATGDEPDVVNWGGRLHFDDLDIDQSTLADSVPAFPAGSKVLDDLRAEVKRINDHPSAEYYIKKSIIVNNLFGVDIMEEAVEICKLRLFLTLIATVERDDSKDNFGVEPLPDIDFNILAGNTLVGYASMQNRQQTRQAASSSSFDFEGEDDRLKDELREFGLMLGYWRKRMLGDSTVPEVTKATIISAAERITPRLDNDLFKLFKQAGLLARVVGKKLDGNPRIEDLTEAQFKRTHEPFHWLLAFPGVEAAGGFDVIVGNPPYIELAKVTDYSTRLFETHECGNLYAPLTERSVSLLTKTGRLGLIVPMSLVSTERMAPLRQQLRSKKCRVYLSNFSGDAHPSVLFEGVKFRLTIILATRDSDGELWSTQYNRWFAEERPWLFERLSYANVSALAPGASLIPKIGTDVQRSIFIKIQKLKPLSESLTNQGETFYVHRVITMFIKALSFVPFFRSDRDGEKKSEDYKPYVAANAEVRACAVSAINSSTFFFYFTSLGDCFHCGKEHVESFPIGIDTMSSDTKASLVQMEGELMASLRKHSVRKTALSQKTGRFEYDEFWQRHSKSEIDRIDGVLADHFGFEKSEVEFIVNADLKYRLGAAGVEDDD